jgi:serine/threonine protein kinase
MNKKELEKVHKLIGTDINRYTVTKYINSGSFGDVFEAKNKKTGELVALKIPILNDERDGLHSLLEEAKVYKHISDRENGIAEMKIIKYNDRKIIVMDLLGSSLEELLNKHKRFNMQTIISLAISMISVLKHIHSKGFIHRDIKPDNFVLGHTDPTKLYCIDFGLAKKYVKKNGCHIPFCENKKFCGTARYSSISSHKGREQSRKDDLESIGYLLVYLYKEKLPWQGIKNKDKNKRYELIGEKKDKTSIEDLCLGMPKEFIIFLKYVKNLDFDEKPHYSALKKMFYNLYKSKNYKDDKLEWNQ